METDFYNNGVVRVTRTLFEVPGTQFPIRNIAAVKTRKINPDRKGPIVCIIIGVVTLAAFVGILLIIGGIWWLVSQKPTYWLIVVSGGSDLEAYASNDATQIREIQSAVNAALAQH
ncbi:MAG: DUF6232 family protein [Hormoscilla sp.]